MDAYRPIDYWQSRWEKGETGWHKGTVDPYLTEHCRELFGEPRRLKVFVPLCGKTPDLKWLADQGFKVVGLEGCEQPIRELFEEQLKVTPVLEEKNGGTLYRTPDDSIRVYHCDLFDFNKDSEGQFDAIWDVGSLVAINAGDREKYVTLIMTLMKPTSSFAVKVFEYNDQPYFSGPPCSISHTELDSLYAKHYVINRLEQYDKLIYARESFSDKLQFFNSVYYKLVLRQPLNC